MKIGIVGAGYVGRSIGVSHMHNGHEVIFHDIDSNTLNSLKKDGYETTSNIIEAVKENDCTFICVPTPTGNVGIILDHISSASKECGSALEDKEEKHIFVIKSTILPGTTENIVIPLIVKYSKKNFDIDFGVIYSPEFITEISSTWTNDNKFQITPTSDNRVVLGENENKYWGDVLIKELHNSKKSQVIRTDYKTAEMIKYASNCMLATKISFWNEIFLICQKLGIDSNEVAEVVSIDPRIGIYGSVHGKAYGGQCLPKDLKAFISFADKLCNTKILKAADELNEIMKNKHGVRE